MTEVLIDHIGIMGGGMNAALLCLEAKKKGIKTTIVDNNMYCPAARIADEHLVSSLNKDSLLKLIQRTKAVVFTTKLENTDDYSILLKEKIQVYPEFEILNVLSSRQKLLWKMEQQEIPILPYKRLENKMDLLKFLKDAVLPVKVIQYYKDTLVDGENNEIILQSDEDFVDLLVDGNQQIDYYLVEEINLELTTLSIGVTRDIKGKMYTYNVAEDSYDMGQWIQAHIPARITKVLQNKALSLAKKTIRKLGGTGTYTVQIIIGQDKELYVKDILPYATESAAYTLESSSISQYDHLLRTIMGTTLFTSVYNGVTFLHLENKSMDDNMDYIRQVLAKPGTNLYTFQGKTPNETSILYTFKADTWETLEENIKL